MKKTEKCSKCTNNYGYCLVCLNCDNTICYQCSLHLVDDKIEGFFCSNKCVYEFTDAEYEHGNGD